jgi:hypothetical protein
MAEYTRQRGRRAARAAQQQQEEQEQLRLDQEHEQQIRREQEFQFQPELLTHEGLLTELTNEKLFSDKELFMNEKLLVAGNDTVLTSENLLVVHELRTHEELLFDQGLLTHDEKLFTEHETLTNEDPLSSEPAETGTAAQCCPPTSEEKEEKGKGVPRDESAGGAPHVGSRGGPSAHNEEEDPPSSCPAPAQTTPHHHLAEDLETNTSFDKSEEDLTAEEGYQPVAPHRRRSFRRAHSHSPSHGGGGARQLGVLLNSSTATLDSTTASISGQHMSERMNMFREQPPADKAEKPRSTGGEIFRAALERLSFRRSSKKKKDKKAKSDATPVTAPTKAVNGDTGSYVSGVGGGVQELRSVLASDPAVSKELAGTISPVQDSGIIDSNCNSNGPINTPETETSQAPSSPPRRIPSHNKPPLPPTRSRRAAPVSAQWEQSRPLNQLDAALQQFKRSAAQSRENLALSRPDIALIQARGNSYN